MSAEAMSAARRKRPRRHVESHDFALFVRRIIAAHGRRVGCDVDALGDLASLGRDIERALAAGVEALRAEGRSWAEIGDRLDISRQAAQQRWGA